MEVVAVTGGSGLVGRFVVQRLRSCDRVREIRILDRVPPDTRVSHDISIRHHVIDLCDDSSVEAALAGCTAVVHCAHAAIPTTYQDREHTKLMWRDNLHAAEVVVDKMLCRGVRRLVYVGDAYSSLPIEDNYGLGEDMFSEMPRNYMLGEYGESRMRAEVMARKAVEKNPSLHGLFLRPVHVHGEGGNRLLRSLGTMAGDGALPYIEGDRRGMHQFIYAGNLASIVERSLECLSNDPSKYSGEIVYALDDTNLYSYRQFLENRLNRGSFSSENAVSFRSSWISHYYNYIRNQWGLQVPAETMSYPLFRLLFEKTVGFSNQKLRLLMDYVPEVPQEKALQLSAGAVEEVTEKPRIVRRTHLRSG